MSHLHRARIRRHRAAIARHSFPPPEGVKLLRVVYRSQAGMPGGTIYLASKGRGTIDLPVAPMRGQKITIVAGLIALARVKRPWLNFLQKRQRA